MGNLFYSFLAQITFHACFIYCGVISFIFMTITNSIEMIGLASEYTVTVYILKIITVYFQHTEMYKNKFIVHFSWWDRYLQGLRYIKIFKQSFRCLAAVILGTSLQCSYYFYFKLLFRIALFYCQGIFKLCPTGSSVREEIWGTMFNRLLKLP